MLSLKVHTNIKTSQCVVTKNHMGKKKKSNIGPLRTVLQVTLANDHPVTDINPITNIIGMRVTALHHCRSITLEHPLWSWYDGLGWWHLAGRR